MGYIFYKLRPDNRNDFEITIAGRDEVDYDTQSIIVDTLKKLFIEKLQANDVVVYFDFIRHD